MANSTDYVWEKLYAGLMALCGKGTLKARLENATVSALMRLDEDDLDGDLGEDLKYILRWTKDNIEAGSLKKEPNDVELSNLIEKMLHVMLETHEHGDNLVR